MVRADLIIMKKYKRINGMEVSVLMKEGPDLSIAQVSQIVGIASDGRGS